MLTMRDQSVQLLQEQVQSLTRSNEERALQDSRVYQAETLRLKQQLEQAQNRSAEASRTIEALRQQVNQLNQEAKPKTSSTPFSFFFHLCAFPLAFPLTFTLAFH